MASKMVRFWYVSRNVNTLSALHISTVHFLFYNSADSVTHAPPLQLAIFSFFAARYHRSVPFKDSLYAPFCPTTAVTTETGNLYLCGSLIIIWQPLYRNSAIIWQQWRQCRHHSSCLYSICLTPPSPGAQVAALVHMVRRGMNWSLALAHY